MAFDVSGELFYRIMTAPAGTTSKIDLIPPKYHVFWTAVKQAWASILWTWVVWVLPRA
jgi:hypothetical protein